MHTPAVRQFARGVASISDCVCVGERVIHDHLTHHTPVPPPHALFELLDLPWSRWLVFTFFLPLSLSPFLLSHSPPPPHPFHAHAKVSLRVLFLGRDNCPGRHDSACPRIPYSGYFSRGVIICSFHSLLPSANKCNNARPHACISLIGNDLPCNCSTYHPCEEYPLYGIFAVYIVTRLWRGRGGRQASCGFSIHVCTLPHTGVRAHTLND